LLQSISKFYSNLFDQTSAYIVLNFESLFTFLSPNNSKSFLQRKLNSQSLLYLNPNFTTNQPKQFLIFAPTQSQFYSKSIQNFYLKSNPNQLPDFSHAFTPNQLHMFTSKIYLARISAQTTVKTQFLLQINSQFQT
jgi:hypothetical protein